MDTPSKCRLATPQRPVDSGGTFHDPVRTGGKNGAGWMETEPNNNNAAADTPPMRKSVFHSGTLPLEANDTSTPGRPPLARSAWDGPRPRTPAKSADVRPAGRWRGKPTVAHVMPSCFQPFDRSAGTGGFQTGPQQNIERFGSADIFGRRDRGEFDARS